VTPFFCGGGKKKGKEKTIAKFTLIFFASEEKKGGKGWFDPEIGEGGSSPAHEGGKKKTQSA